jgi:archaemetzincin
MSASRGEGKTRRRVVFVLIDEVDSLIMAEVTSLAGRVLGLGTSVQTNLRCEGGFDPARGQWRAETMLERCVIPHASPDSYVVGLTGKDLYVQSLNFVFGLAVRESGAAIVSLRRLMGGAKETVVARTAKEVIHEVGHLEGLAHCNDKTCVMWFSNTLSETDRKGEGFCPACRVRLSS